MGSWRQFPGPERDDAREGSTLSRSLVLDGAAGGVVRGPWCSCLAFWREYPRPSVADRRYLGGNPPASRLGGSSSAECSSCSPEDCTSPAAGPMELRFSQVMELGRVSRVHEPGVERRLRLLTTQLRSRGAAIYFIRASTHGLVRERSEPVQGFI